MIVIVEATEDEALLWQTQRLPRWHALGDFSLAVVDLIAIRQVDDFFRKEPPMIDRSNDLVSDDVINELCSHRAGVTEIVHLNRYWSIYKNAEPHILRIPLQINRDINLTII